MNLSSEYQLASVIDILDERARQDQKWGEQQHHSRAEWAVILGEEFGEVCRDILERAPREKLQAEITQCAAVCLAWLEALSGSIRPIDDEPPSREERNRWAEAKASAFGTTC